LPATLVATLYWHYLRGFRRTQSALAVLSLNEFPQYFDEDLSDDVAAILHAAALLDSTEYLVFELAYKDWFGEKATDQRVERYFTRYMFAEEVPVWVRQYARKVITLNQEGKLNPRALGVYKPLPSRRMMLIGKVYTGLLLAVFLGLTYAAYKETGLFGNWGSFPRETNSDYRHDHRAMP